MARPLLLLAVALVLGCAVGEDVGPAGAAILLGLSALTLVAAASQPSSRFSGGGLLAAAVGIGAAGAAIEAAAYERLPLVRWVEAGPTREPMSLEGVAYGDARDTGDRFTLVLDVERGELPGRGAVPPGRVRVDVGGDALRPEIIDGDRLRLFATLARPRGFSNPGSFDVLGAARRGGLAATGYCKSAKLVTTLGRGEVGVLRDLTARGRRWARGVFRRFVPPGPEEGLVRAMVLGDRTGVEPGTAEAFRVAGTFHVLALSGAQVALLAALFVGALHALRAPAVLVALLTAVGLTLYAVFVGADVPVVRAAVMAVVVIGGRALDLDADLANLLGLAAIALVVHRPSNVFDVGFQLSFGATLGLLLLTSPVLTLLPRMLFRLQTAVAASLAAQVALVPLLAAQFHRLTPAAVLLNLLAVPLSSAVLLSGFAVLALAGVPLLARTAGGLAWIAAHALLRSCEPASWLPWLDPRVATPTALAALLYLAGAVSLLKSPRRPRTFAFLSAGLLLIIIPRTAVGDGRFRLTVLDVGQGDGLVLRSPSGRVLLVDAGGTYDGRFDVGEAVVGPFLWSQGISSIDGIVATHAHPDHVGGIPALLRSFRVGVVWEGVAPRGDPVYESFEAALVAARARRRGLARGMSDAFDGARIRVAGPAPPGVRPWRTRNDDSVVLEVRYGGVGIVLAGDVEAAGEARLDLEAASILKVPHHGSRSSSTPSFLRQVSPRIALISAGFRNRFGHPDPTVVERYRQSGAWVLRTSEDGALTVSTDGQRVWVETYRDGRPVRLR
jgi:competence protein ComEC